MVSSSWSVLCWNKELTFYDGLVLVFWALRGTQVSQLLAISAAGDVGLDLEAVALPVIQASHLYHTCVVVGCFLWTTEGKGPWCHSRMLKTAVVMSVCGGCSSLCQCSYSSSRWLCSGAAQRRCPSKSAGVYRWRWQWVSLSRSGWRCLHWPPAWTWACRVQLWRRSIFETAGYVHMCVLWSLKSLLTFQYYTELNENDSFNKQLMCWHKMISFSLSLLNDHINNLLMLTLLSGPVDRTTPDDRVSHCGPLRTLSSHWRTLQVVQNKKTGVFVCLFTFQIL